MTVTVNRILDKAWNKLVYEALTKYKAPKNCIGCMNDCERGFKTKDGKFTLFSSNDTEIVYCEHWKEVQLWRKTKEHQDYIKWARKEALSKEELAYLKYVVG